MRFTRSGMILKGNGERIRMESLEGGPGTGQASLITTGLRDKDKFYSNGRLNIWVSNLRF